ncbi:MAG: hypothetical protein JWL60_1282 [Gemmatimonadetes bacterium]|nr:hypothetical protein [Gemmatimonadota bacterium]
MITPTVASPAIPPAAAPGAPGAPAAPPRAESHTSAMRLLASRSPASAADSVWVPLASGALILVAGAMTLATKSPWLFAALGPTAVLIAANPGHATTRFHAVVLGHLTALACGWLAVLLMGASGAGVSVSRIWASAAAIAATTLVQPSLRAYHPPAAATALLVTLGVYTTSWKNVGSMLAGVLVVALVGEWLQRVRLRETGRSLAT